MTDRGVVLFVCEPYYLRFYGPLARQLAGSGFRPVWICVGGADRWDHDRVELGTTIEALASMDDLARGHDVDALCAFERAVFERPGVFRDNYPYTLGTVRTRERIRPVAAAWFELTLALIQRFQPRAVCLWNGRYLPYSGVAGACAAAGQPFLTSEIGWLPGTIFLDRGPLSADTADLTGRTFEAGPSPDGERPDLFLADYRRRKATMVAQAPGEAGELRRRLLGPDGRFLLLYGCQVDWDTNVVIGARRFQSNEAAVAFLVESLAHVPGARLVVKTHPLDADKKEAELRAVVGGLGDVVSDVHPHALIEASDCVAVRNSTLGFEALCYDAPVMALEPAKYNHPALTLEAGSVAQAGEQLRRLAAGERLRPDREALRRFVQHVLDHYLVPGRYDYHFAPGQLDILSHLSHNDSYASLERLLETTTPGVAATADPRAVTLLDRCAVQRSRGPFRRLTRWTDWLRRR